MLLVMKIEKLDPQAFLDMEENKDITITGRGENIYFKDDYLKELEEKARKYDELIEKKERAREEYERLEKEAEPLREKAKGLKAKSLELINHLDEMISEAKKNSVHIDPSMPTFKNTKGYLGAKVEPRRNF